MREQKNENETGLAGMPTRRLLSRRRALAARLGGAEQVLSGLADRADAAVRQARLPVRRRRAARPVCLLRPEDRGPGPAGYVPASLAGVVRRYLRNGEEIEQLLAEISAINAELLARRELS